MTKIISLAIVVSLSMSSFGAQAFAKSKDNNQDIFSKENLTITYSKEEIKNLKELKERAKKGISDIPLNDLSPVPNIQINDGSQGNEKVFRTAQLLQTAKKANGTILNRVAITSFTYDESKYASEDDQTLGNKAYSTIYVDDWYDPRGVKYWDLQHISGGWTLDTNVSITSGTITAGQGGATYGGVGFSDSIEWKVSGLTFDYDVPSSWKPVTSAGGGNGTMGTVVGCTTKVTYKRGTTTWTPSPLVNNYKA
ncbi:hypothetical protein [Paenibacillus puldeungensis]